MQQVLTWIGKKVSSRKKRIRLETNNARRPVFEGFESRIMFSYPSPYMDTPVTVDCQGANVTVHGQPDSSGDYPVGYLLSNYDMSGTRLTYWESQMSGQANSYTFPDISAPAGTQYQYAATATYPANGLDPGGTSPSSGMTPFQNVMLDINNGGISQTGVLDINKIDIARADPESGASHAQKYTLTDAGIQIDQGVLAHSGLVYGNGSIIDDQISVGWPGQVGVTLTQSMQNGIDNTAYDLLPHSFTTQIPVGTPQNVTAWVAGVNTTNHKIDVSVNWDAVPGFTYSSIVTVYRRA